MKSIINKLPNIRKPLKEDGTVKRYVWYELGVAAVIDIIEVISDEISQI